jgi:hypothetical protein
MHLIYLDESGNSGARLDDPAQPVLVLAALVIPFRSWQAVDSALSTSLARRWPEAPDGFEIHASDLINPTQPETRALTPSARMDFALEWLGLARSNGLKVLHRPIDKVRFRKWQTERLGQGIQLHPQVVAFALLARTLDAHLASLPGDALGILIFDENKQIARDLDKSLRLLREAETSLRPGRIIERGFFIESHRSLPLQLCDLCVYFLRRRYLVRAGAPARPFEEEVFRLLSEIAPDPGDTTREMVTWLETLPKRMRPGA